MLIHAIIVLFLLNSFTTFVLSDCPQECTQTQSDHSKPICASNGKAYHSICEMLKDNCSNTRSDWETCRGIHPLCPSDCLDIQDPVCGDDGKVYPNKCVMHKRNCGKEISMRPSKYCFSKVRHGRNLGTCPTSCLELYKPVCGSNGQIYLNDCLLKQQNCGNDVNVVDMSHCVKGRTCPEACIALYDPVCGSDKKVYLNHCRMLKDTCGLSIKRMPLRYCVGDDEDKV